jgi:predicted O-linked N-acetylglucosamine transferase (SPINDLY family)
VTTEQALHLALTHHQAGRRAEAEAIYRQVLARDPEHADALHWLGVLVGEAGDLNGALALLERAAARAPGVPEFQSNLGEFYRRAGRLNEAIVCLERALVLRPDMAVAQGNLGNALREAGRIDEAIAALERASALEPRSSDHAGNLGLALQAAGRIDEAVVAHERSAALAPGDPVAHRNLGTALHAAGRSGAAVAAYQRALALRPGDARTYCNLGMTLQETGHNDEAIAALERAAALDATLAPVYTNLGNALWAVGRLDEAAATLGRAIALDPRDADAHNNLGNVLKDQGRLDDAIAAFHRAEELRPGSPRAGSNRLFTLWAHPGYDAHAILGEHRAWAERHAVPLAAEIRPHANDRTPGRRLNVGYVSPDFRGHPVGHLLVSLLKHHDRRQVEVVCYSDVRAPDALTQKLRALADQWHDTAALPDRMLAERVRADRIDILVDLALHTAGNRLLVFARKPAPVQVTMLGLPATTGVATIDYRLTDPFIDPPDADSGRGAHDSDYTEQSIRLPHCFWLFERPEEAPVVGALPALSNGCITFGSLNQFAKVTPAALQLWLKILQAVPRSRLLIQAQPGSHCDAVRARFQAGGIAGDRLEFAGRVSRAEYFQRYGRLDLGLDPFPYNGHNCTIEALWMGVPVVTLAGRTAVARGGLSILSNVGLEELIARTPEEYVDIAVRMAGDAERLAAFRAELRGRMEASPLMECRGYAAAVEAALRRMWHAWCGG